MTLRTKIVVLLSVISLICCGLVTGLFLIKRSDFKTDAAERIGDAAKNLNEIIDRNLFERYGDVQVFAQNRAAYVPANWRNASESNPLVSAINRYISNYGIYSLSMLVSTDGEVLAVNTRDAAGKSINSAKLYDKNMASEPWFSAVKQGKFLEGRDGLTPYARWAGAWRLWPLVLACLAVLWLVRPGPRI